MSGPIPCRRRRWPQSTPQRGSIEIGYRVAFPASLRAHALRYRELKGREITWALPG
jgi:hypothetical protein